MELGTANVSMKESSSGAVPSSPTQQEPKEISNSKPPTSDAAAAASASSDTAKNNTSNNSNAAPSPGYYSYSTANQDQQQQPQSTSPGYVDFDMHARLQQSALYDNRSQFGGGTNLPHLPLTPSNGSDNNNSDVKSPTFLQRGVFNPMDGTQKVDAMSLATSAPGQAPLSPAMPYLNNAGQMQPPAYGAGLYQGVYTEMNNRHVPLSPQPNWNNRSMQHQMYQQPLGSPSPYTGMGGVYTTTAGAGSNIIASRSDQPRTSSFDETTMLPPSAISSSESLDQYSQNAHYGAGNNTMFAHHPPQWATGPHHHAPGIDMYSPVVTGPLTSTGPISPVSPRLATSNKRGGGRAFHPGPHQLPYFHLRQHTTVTPGPPIQTTNSNKGPDGANLFIFHIPNNFTNLDMYNLFCPFGSLLSVRIMVEKDTGRSRGFGFVSYSSPESAASAIKELNGYVIGNKRLKVQHKQIKPDHSKSEDNTRGWYDNSINDNRVENTRGKTPEAEDKSCPQDAVSNENVVESSNALNCMDSIREALPESSS